MRFRSDSRSQAIQIGAVLIFGLLIVVLASYQAFVVPSQNAEIEFNHHQEVDRDMVTLRGEILQAKTTGEDRFATVTLGTEFPTRLIAQNPSNPSGTLRTSDNKTFVVETTNDDTLDDLFTEFSEKNRFLTYTPNYAEYREGGPIRYENTVVYKEFSNANVMLSGQRIVQNDTLSLIPLHREIQASGGQTVPVEPVPSAVQTEEGVDVDTIEIGTQLKEEDWEDLLEDELENGVLSSISVTEGENENILELDFDTPIDIEYSPVGLDRQPVALKPGEDALDINPAAPSDVRIVSSERFHNNDYWEATFENAADATNITEARVNFYAVGSGGDAETLEEIEILEPEETRGSWDLFWEIGDDFQPFEPEELRLVGDDERTVIRFQFDDVSNNDLFFVFTVTFETGERGTYFIGESPEGGN